MKALIVANWKMHPANLEGAKKLFDATKKIAEKAAAVTIVVAPPTLFLHDLAMRYKGKKISFAVQSARAEAEGAFTGDVSLSQAKAAGAKYAIVAHAECRAAGETDEDARMQVAAALALKMTPILCVGESERDESGSHFTVIKTQLMHACEGLDTTQMSKVVIAYEPVWKIGAQSAMSPHEMHEMSIFIRKTLVEIAPEAGMKAKILYGGSIDEASAQKMMREGDVAGLLIGRASIDSSVLSAIVRTLETA